MSRFARITSFLLLLAVFLTACGGAVATPTANPQSPTPLSLTDGLGRTITLPQPAQRIVSLAPSNTEIVFALGAGAQLVGRDDFSDYPAAAVNVPSIGSLYPQANAEAILALKPDLVLAAGITSPDEVQKLEALGLTVYATRFNTTLDDVYADIEAVGALTGHTPEATALVAEMKARVATVQATVAQASTQPVVFYEIDATEPAKPWTPGPGSFVDVLITLAGGQNVATVVGLQDAYAQISLEQLVAHPPEIIILGSATYGGQTPETVQARAGWENLLAVQNGQVYPFDDNLLTRPGPRVVEGLEALAKLIQLGAAK